MQWVGASNTVSGAMDVNIEAEPRFLMRGSLRLNRNMVSKKFYGDMDGASEAQMVTAFTDISSSAGCLAIEHLTGVGGVLLSDSVSDLAQVIGWTQCSRHFGIPGCLVGNVAQEKCE